MHGTCRTTPNDLKQKRVRFVGGRAAPVFPAATRTVRNVRGRGTVVRRTYRRARRRRCVSTLMRSFYDIINDDGSRRGSFFVDLYARTEKAGRRVDGRMRRPPSIRLEEAESKPVAYLVCNFMPPVGKQPSLLTHSEVATMFHEFGHGLHHMLTRIDYPSIAGINGVAWDAVGIAESIHGELCRGVPESCRRFLVTSKPASPCRKRSSNGYSVRERSKRACRRCDN